MPTPAPEVYAPTTLYRQGVRDPAVTAAHLEQLREWRRGIADALFDADDQQAFLTILADVGDPEIAANRVGVTLAQVYGRTRWDADWATRLDEALTAVCPARPHCGTIRGYRQLKGRCPACRAAKYRERGGTRARYGSRLALSSA